MDQQFVDFLDMDPTTYERPKPVPKGSYLTAVRGHPMIDEGGDGKSPYVQVTFALLEAGQDVDPGELEAFGGLDGKTISTRLYRTEKAAFMIADFLKACGIEAGRTAREMLAETPNCEVGIYVAHRPSQDGQRIEARPSRYFPAEAFARAED
jgi:hypothetical protein